MANGLTEQQSIDWPFSANDGTLINNYSCQEAVIVWFLYRFFPFIFIWFKVPSFVLCEFNASSSHSANSFSMLDRILLCMSAFICFPSCITHVTFGVLQLWRVLTSFSFENQIKYFRETSDSQGDSYRGRLISDNNFEGKDTGQLEEINIKGMCLY